MVWLVGQADQVTDEKDKAAAKADAVRTGAAIALGTGGAAWLLLAYRRQRMEAVDTRERRITELYTTAVEQLGHEKAPVRLGALYSLERLAQDNPEHRQTVIDVFCAYLRMPYSLPMQNESGTEQAKEAATTEDGIPAAHSMSRRDSAQEELQVRQTAQRILAAHLQLPQGISSAAAQRRQPSPRRAFWPGISLDLTGADLVDLEFHLVSVIQARFDEATFQGDARFNKATFQRYAGFHGATFEGYARFNGATFQGYAGFNGATFQGIALFTEATFQDGARFGEATFQGDAMFPEVIVKHDAWFGEATFQGDARFNKATFQDLAGFGEATFQGDATFDRATFSSDDRDMRFGGARVLHMDNPDLRKSRVWPNGWTVRPDPARPSRGTLVRAEQAEEREPVVPPSDPTGR